MGLLLERDCKHNAGCDFRSDHKSSEAADELMKATGTTTDTPPRLTSIATAKTLIQRTITTAQGVRKFVRSGSRPYVPTLQGGAANNEALAAEIS